MLRFLPVVPIAPLLLLAFLVGIPPEPASATQVQVPDVEGLSLHADLIVIATVLDAESAWRDGRIETRTTLVPRVLLHGSASGAIEVRTPGGRIGDIATRVHGTERLAPGDTYLLFLQAMDEEGAWQSIALAWGVYELEGVGSETWIRRQGGGGSASENRMPLAALESRVAEALATRPPAHPSEAAEPTPPASAPEPVPPDPSAPDIHAPDAQSGDGDRLRPEVSP